MVKTLNDAETQLNDTIASAVAATGNAKIVPVNPSAYFDNGWECSSTGDNNPSSLFNPLQLDGTMTVTNESSFPYLPSIQITKSWPGTTAPDTGTISELKSLADPGSNHPNQSGQMQLANAINDSISGG